MANSLPDLRVAIVHYWFVARRGGERVVEALAEMFPQADLFTLVLDRAALPPSLQTRRITPSFLQKFPGAKKHYQKFLPFFPLAVESLNVDDYDLVISSESGPAKGVLTTPHTRHICYCHSPMRYLWDMYHDYRERPGMGRISRAVFTASAHYVRMWDLATASRVDHFVANSANVAARIRKHYRREAAVIYPPCDVSGAAIGAGDGEYYLAASQLVRYKRLDLAIGACRRLGRKLRIIGDGEEYARLRKTAGPDVDFLGYLEPHAMHEQYAHCRALLFPGEEDFGIVPVEAQAHGRPVIAYGRGGALETVKGICVGEAATPETSTGVFFAPQSVEALVDAIRLFESMEKRFSPAFIRSQAERFDAFRFKSEMAAFIEEKMHG